jgi:hypothetical protein
MWELTELDVSITGQKKTAHKESPLFEWLRCGEPESATHGDDGGKASLRLLRLLDHVQA